MRAILPRGYNPQHMTASDKTTSIDELRALVRRFIDEREWGGYHTPRNLAASISIEANELLEHFQWVEPGPDALDDKVRHEVGEEMADVFAYLLSLSHVLGIDLAAALAAKMHKNARKYPADQFRRRWHKVRS